MDVGRVDLFISHAGSDQAWAEWAAWELEQAGYRVELDVWDWAAGANFVVMMSDALDRADRVLALYSRAYFDRARYTTQEWSASLLHLPGMSDGRLVPVRVEDVPAQEIPAVLRALVFRDVFDLPEDQARQVLLEAVRAPSRPDRAPAFPAAGGIGHTGGSAPGFPGTVPEVWNIPPRNLSFTGRDAVLAGIRDQMLSGGQPAIQVLTGMGGAGKTQLAAEYAHRFAGDYNLAWWIAAEQSELIGEQFAALTDELHCAESGAPVALVRQAVLAELRNRGRWLLIFDNAQAAEDIKAWLPAGRGHVLLTSRAQHWAEVAADVPVDTMDRPDSVALLRRWVPLLGDEDGDDLAGQLGDLPLGLAQAGGYLRSTGMTAGEYLTLLETRAAELLERGQPSSYPLSLAAATQLAVEELTESSPAAGELVGIAAFLAPEPIPVSWLAAAAAVLPEVLSAQATDPLTRGDLLAHLGGHSLARVDERGVQFHRLTQAIVRDQMPGDLAASTRRRAADTVAVNHPGDPDDPATWPGWARLLPHLLATDLSDHPGLRLQVAGVNAAWYLIMRGDAQAGLDLARLFHARASESPEEQLVSLGAGNAVATALVRLGRLGEARQVGQDVLDRARQINGQDHPNTLASAITLAVILREADDVRAASDLDTDTLTRARQVFGIDDPRTLAVASNLAIEMRRLGDTAAARDMDRDILNRRRQILSPDHPATLTSAHNLAADYRELGQISEARALDEATLTRRRSILGPGHPDTLATAGNLALELRTLGELDAARDLGEDTLDRYRQTLGSDHRSSLLAAQNLAPIHRDLDEPGKARDLDQDTLDRLRRIKGEDHPDTLMAAHLLAFDLRALEELDEARDLDQETFSRRRETLGPDHPDTLWSATSLAGDLYELGDLHAARDLNKDTLQRRRRILGDDHPDTRASATNLAITETAIARHDS